MGNIIELPGQEIVKYINNAPPDYRKDAIKRIVLINIPFKKVK